MNILHFACYYNPHIGGIERVAEDVVNSIGREHNQRVICFNHEKRDAADEINGVEIIRAKCFAKVASQQLSFTFYKLLKRQFKEFRPDVLIFHYPNPFAAHYVLKVLKKHKSCKLVLYWHLDITKQKILGKLFNGQTKRLLARADKVVATSPNYIEGSKFLSSAVEKCVIVPNCVDSNITSVTEDNRAEAEKIRNECAGKTICFAVGRHVPYKGIEYLVRAAKLLDENFKIIIGGQGSLTDSLKKLAEGDDKVKFVGRLDQESLKAYMLACDIFCFPSITKNEAFGIALAEAMSFGKPAVTFTIEGSGVNYVSLNGVTGIEVENGNVEFYAEAVRTLANDKALRERYGKAAIIRQRDLFTEEQFKINIGKVIQSL